jgi:hypothetical protein
VHPKYIHSLEKHFLRKQGHSGNTGWVELAHTAIFYPSIWMDLERHPPPRVVVAIEFATHLASHNHLMRLKTARLCFLPSLCPLLHLILCFVLLSRH